MKLSTKAQHASTAMINLAMNNGIRPVTLAEISKNQGISLSYLEQLFSKMRKAELVEGVRGPGGGYKLAKSPEETCMPRSLSQLMGGPRPMLLHTRRVDRRNMMMRLIERNCIRFT